MATKKKTSLSTFKREEVPFVPAYDLYEESLKYPTQDEILAIAATLWLQIAPAQKDAQLSTWALQGRMSALQQRL